MLSSPAARSNKCRAAIRGGFLSAFSVPGAGMLITVDPYCDAGQRFAPSEELIGTPSGFAAVGACARIEPQNSPASNCWSGVIIDASTTVSLPAGPLLQSPPAHGTAPATKPLSYRQLKPI